MLARPPLLLLLRWSILERSYRAVAMDCRTSLPEEALEKIAVKVGDVSFNLLDDSAWSEHYADLRSLCLVARRFRIVAQTLLAESLYTKNDTTTKLWLESTGTDRHDTKTLVINGSTGLDLSDSLWESILAKARSVETILTFYILRPRSKQSLAHPALSSTFYLRSEEARS